MVCSKNKSTKERIDSKPRSGDESSYLLVVGSRMDCIDVSKL